MSGWVVRYPRRKGEPPRYVGPFYTRDVAQEWHKTAGDPLRRPEFSEVETPEENATPLPKIPTYVWIRKDAPPRFTRVHELAELNVEHGGDWFVVGEEKALRPGEVALIERFETQDNVTIHVEHIVARRTVTHRKHANDYGTPVRYVLAAFTNRHPEGKQS